MTDQTSPAYKKRLQEHENRLARLHQKALERNLFLNPAHDFIFYLILPKLEDEEEVLLASERILTYLVEMMQGKAHPHGIRKLFDILALNKSEVENNPEFMRQLDVLCSSSHCQRIKGKDFDWDSTLKAIAALPHGMDDNAASKLLRLKLYRAFNKFLLACAAPQLSPRDETGELRWFKQALVCYLKATALRQTPECQQTALEILQDMRDCLYSSSAISLDQA